uniref:Uncharacterized protein n=1 Tax=Tetranychus urticae TaxID=32264 RepID=T1KE52_TETUR
MILISKEFQSKICATLTASTSPIILSS